MPSRSLASIATLLLFGDHRVRAANGMRSTGSESRVFRVCASITKSALCPTVRIEEQDARPSGDQRVRCGLTVLGNAGWRSNISAMVRVETSCQTHTPARTCPACVNPECHKRNSVSVR